MQLKRYENITRAFGENAKWIELSHSGMKGFVFRSNSNKLSNYDEIHLGKFVSSGVYRELFKRLRVELGECNRIVFDVEYGVLKVCIIRKSADTSIKVLKRFSIGLFYGRTLEELTVTAKSEISQSLMAEINTEVLRVRYFFEQYSRKELLNEDALAASYKSFENLSGEELSNKEKRLIEKYVYRTL